MRTPAFWWQAKPSPLARILLPAAHLYGAITGRRMTQPGAKVGIPVLCIGNFTAGGAGKTPTALAVADLLLKAGERPAFLSRGYGGSLAGPVEVTQAHTAEDVGDEPLLLARKASAIVSRDRPAGAGLAQFLGATVIIMDDGLQNPSLRKNLSIVVVDGTSGIGNGLTLPAGPLRAPLETQWPHVDAVLIIGPGQAGKTVAEEAARRNKPVFSGELVPDSKMAVSLKDRRVLAFAGIGRPAKFFATLEALGAHVEIWRAFGDHHPYTERDIARLSQEAERLDLQLVTTEKDLARIGPLARNAQPILTLPVHLRLAQDSAWRDFILSSLQSH